MAKTEAVRVRLSLDEKLQLDALSISLIGKKNRSRLVRKLIRDALNLDLDLLDAERLAFQQAIIQLSGVARNLNQITKLYHQGKAGEKRFSDFLLESLIDKVDALNTELKQYVKNTRFRGKKS
jgi:metal-responsive CopG/Arc/MetJ family transcriptional regulator